MDEANQKVAEWGAKLEDMDIQIKEKESIVEKKVEENFTLKKIIDNQKSEINSLQRKCERIEDQVTNKELELRQVTQDFTEFKKKHNSNEKGFNLLKATVDAQKNEIMGKDRQIDELGEHNR